MQPKSNPTCAKFDLHETFQTVADAIVGVSVVENNQKPIMA